MLTGALNTNFEPLWQLYKANSTVPAAQEPEFKAALAGDLAYQMTTGTFTVGGRSIVRSPVAAADQAESDRRANASGSNTVPDSKLNPPSENDPIDGSDPSIGNPSSAPRRKLT